MSKFPLGSAVVEIKAEFSKFRDDLAKAKRETTDASDRMSRSLKMVGTAAKGIAAVGVAGAAAAAGLFALVQRAANAAEEIADMADKVGVSTERLQELRFAFTQNGSSIRDVDAGLSRLNAGLGAFVATGTGPAKEGLAALGITTREAAAALGTGEQAFDEIVKRIAAIPDPAQRAGAAARLFGEEAGPKLAILIGKGAGEIEALSAKAREMGLVLDDAAVRTAAQASAQLRALGEAISTQLTGALIELTPQIAEMAQAFADSLPTILQWIEATGRFFGLLQAPIAEQLSDLRAELEALEGGTRIMPWAAAGTQERIAAIREEIAALEERQRVIDETVRRANTPAEVTVPPLAGPPGQRERTSRFDEMIEAQREAQRAAIEELRMAEMSAEAQEFHRAALEGNRVERELLAAAQREGRELSFEEIAMVAQVATAHEQVTLALARQARMQAQNAAAAQAHAASIKALEDNMIGAISRANSFRDALNQVARALIEAGLQGLVGGRGAFGGFFNDLLGVTAGGLGGLIRGAISGPAMPAPTFASGGLYASGAAFARGRVVPFARGGVVTGPTTFPMADGMTGLMGEAGEEAVMPLDRGPDGKLGVRASGGGAIRVYLDEGLRAEIVGEARGQTIEIVEQSQRGPAFAARVASASRTANNSRMKA